MFFIIISFNFQDAVHSHSFPVMVPESLVHTVAGFPLSDLLLRNTCTAVVEFQVSRERMDHPENDITSHHA